MSSTLRVTNVSDTTGGTSTNLMSGLAKAWADFDQNPTSLDDSFNVSSIDDDGTGLHGLNFTSSFASTEFAKGGTCEANGNVCVRNVTETAGDFSMHTITNGGSDNDYNRSSAICVGDLA